MKSPKIFLAAWLAMLGLAFFAAPSAHTQGPGSVRVVRLSRADGEVLVFNSGSNDWEEAPANLPVQEGDSLATQSGFAEIEFENGAMAYLAENSVLQFTQLGFSGGGRVTELTLTQGAGTFDAHLTGQDTFVVHTLTFDVATLDRAEFRIDGFRDGAAVEVMLGSVHVSTTKGSTDLDKGQSVAVHQNDFTNFTIGSLPSAEDAFDRLVTEEGERIRSGNKNTLSYVNSLNSYGLSDLAIYGNWVNLPVYGFTWRPFSTGLTWTPYLNGRWILDPRLGWIWVSNEPWGWMPYHYGTWLLSPAFGWVWVPGGPGGLRQWEPARVNWVQLGGNRVGWVAKSPEDRDGAPANLKKGVITMQVRTSAIGNEPNKILSGKELVSVAPIEQPPKEFASRPAPVRPGATSSGIHSSVHVAAPALSNDSSIVYDGNTHTYIQRNGVSDGAHASDTPAGSAALMPERTGQTNSPTEIPRVPIPPTGPVSSRANRSFLPGFNSSREHFPAVGATPGNIPSNGAGNVQLRSAPANNFRPARPPVDGLNTPIRSAPNSPIRPSVPPPVSSPAVTPSQMRGNPGTAVNPSSQATRPAGSQPLTQRPAPAAPVQPRANAPAQPARQ